MDTSFARRNLAASARAIEALAQIDTEQARWRAAPGRWSLLEIVNHLADEESEDFRQRLQLLVERPGTPWPPLDPEGAVTARDYQARELLPSVRRFLDERAHSLAWLEEHSLIDPHLTYDHPHLGPITAGDLLASWQDHDLLHLRQMLRWHHDRLVEASHPYSPAYAGGW